MSGFITSISTPDIQTFRDAIREISPRWLKRGLAEKILYTFGLHMDLIGDAAANGVKKRFPQLFDSIDALGLTGRSRKISRGRAEPDLSYANRLLSWLDDHRTRGGPYALLHQLAGFWAAAPFDIDLVYESGKRFHMVVGAMPVESSGAPWDTDTAHWARWWLIFDWPDSISTDGLWSDPGTWEDGGVWDFGLSPDLVQDLRQVPREWNAAHAQGRIVLREPGTELWDLPAGLWSDPGTWGSGTFTFAEISAE